MNRAASPSYLLHQIVKASTPASRAVLITGCFDPFHVGHLYHFQEARKMGDPLVIAVLKDGYVNKGKNRPMFKDVERAKVVQALAIVDEVLIVESCVEALASIKPRYWCIGYEYRLRINEDDKMYCRANGIEIIFTNEQTYSSTKICELMRIEAAIV